ncbi:hypothetical protein TRL7639_00134 [Falsiruegeria litorea R37]|uniref:Uncharacterized protein n=1 Tax=Falsiruegeria litorea R37 TaxID=1200284 RepID=A0A1Y5RAB5_9RHOB|nr:hypothetical protein TRL7639_00134 [Falsiruegeria litorea R37]
MKFRPMMLINWQSRFWRKPGQRGKLGAAARSLLRSRKNIAAIARLIRILKSSAIFLILMIPIS